MTNERLKALLESVHEALAPIAMCDDLTFNRCQEIVAEAYVPLDEALALVRGSSEPSEQLCDGATPVRASTAEVVLPNTAESTASPVHPSQGYCGNWPCRLPNYHTGPCNSSPSERT